MLHREMKNAADMYISLLLTLYLDNSIMAYSTHGHISYRPILRGLLGKEKELENKVKLCWGNWMGWFFSFLIKIFDNI